jgi:RNA polymerase sigma-70 factor (ECF subfamily)
VLACRARSGDRRAFSALWQEHAPVLHAILLSMVPEQDADDLLQEAALRAWHAIGDLEDPQRVGPWLSAIARNLGRSALARAAPRVESLEGRPETRRRLVAANRRREDLPFADEILDAIRALPVPYREPLKLRLLLDMTGPEISERTGLRPGSVRVNLCRGLKLLRQRLALAGVMP